MPRLSSWLGVLTLSSGCARTYRVEHPEPVVGRTASVVVYELRLFFVRPSVRLRLGARAGTRLRGVELADLDSAPCSTGLSFDELALDGVVVEQGPVDVSGAHDIAVTFFGERAPKLLRGAAAIDVELDHDDARSCVRVPLLHTADAPNLALADDSAGFALGAGGRGYPIRPASSQRADESLPLGSFYERMGVAFGPHRVWTEVGYGGVRADRFSDLMLSAGTDRVIWEQDRWAAMLGLGYDVVLTYERSANPDEHSSSLRHGMHGPRLAPSISFTIFRDLPGMHVPMGRRTLYLELDAPLSVWFRTDAPHGPWVAPALGLSVFGSL